MAASQPAVGKAKASITSNPKYALLFDCDGVIVLTEELHRLAYNGAFEDFDVRIGGERVDWKVDYYDVLQNTVGGGKPKMKWHFNKNGWPSSRLGPAPSSAEAQDDLVDQLQDCKTEIYTRIVTEVAQARPGVLRLIDEVLRARPRYRKLIRNAAKLRRTQFRRGKQGPVRISKPRSPISHCGRTAQALDRTDIAAGICSAATKAGFDQVASRSVWVSDFANLHRNA